jgi:hypothetical protein
MSTTDQYVTRIKQAQATVLGISEARSREAKALLSRIPAPSPGLAKPGEVIDQNRRLAKVFVDVNVEYVQDLAAAVRKHLNGLARAWKDEVVTTGKLANRQADVDVVAERYEHMTKVELAAELAGRHLPKTGSVAVLRDRLIEDDRKGA